MRSIFIMPSSDMPPSEGEGALPKKRRKANAKHLLGCLPPKCRRPKGRGHYIEGGRQMRSIY